MWHEVGVQIHSFACGSLAVPALCWNDYFFPLNGLENLVENQLAVTVGGYLMAVISTHWFMFSLLLCLVTQSCPTLCNPMDCSPPRLLCPWNSPGKSTGVGCHFLLQGIFLTQGSNLGLLHCRILYQQSYQGSPQSSIQSLNHVWFFVTPWTAAGQASLSITNSQSLLKLISIESVMPSNHLILCRPRLLLPSIFPSIRVFSNESVLCIR